MKLIKSGTIRTIVLMTLLAFVAGCGGQVTPNPTTSGVQSSSTTVPGMHIHAVEKQTKTSWSLGFDGFLPTVHAQSSNTVVVAQNWEGVCSDSPASTGGIASIAVYGVGQSEDPSCSHSWTPNDTDGSSIAANVDGGKLVYGNGTLSNLVVNTDKGTVIATQTGVPVKVFVKRGQSVIDTGLNCTLPVGGNELICNSTAAFAAQNLDRVIAVAIRNDGDQLKGLTVAFTKSVP